MEKFKKKQKGISILGVLFLAVIVILVLSYFDISIKTVVESPAGQDNIGYVKGGTKNLWTEYLREPALYLWNDIWLELFWRPFVDNMERIRDGLPTDFDRAAENLEIMR